MTPKDRAALREKAERATQDASEPNMCIDVNDAQLLYIQASFPHQVLKLIDEVERLERKAALMIESTERHGAGRCDCMHAPCRHDASRFLDEREAETKRATRAEARLATCVKTLKSVDDECAAPWPEEEVEGAKEGIRAIVRDALAKLDAEDAKTQKKTARDE